MRKIEGLGRLWASMRFLEALPTIATDDLVPLELAEAGSKIRLLLSTLKTRP